MGALLLKLLLVCAGFFGAKNFIDPVRFNKNLIALNTENRPKTCADQCIMSLAAPEVGITSLAVAKKCDEYCGKPDKKS